MILTFDINHCLVNGSLINYCTITALTEYTMKIRNVRSVKGNKTTNETFLSRVPVICLSSLSFLFFFFLFFFSIKIVIIISSFPREAFWIPNPFLKRTENWIDWHFESRIPFWKDQRIGFIGVKNECHVTFVK